MRDPAPATHIVFCAACGADDRWEPLPERHKTPLGVSCTGPVRVMTYRLVGEVRPEKAWRLRRAVRS